jgi:hypothetical protein
MLRIKMTFLTPLDKKISNSIKNYNRGVEVLQKNKKEKKKMANEQLDNVVVENTQIDPNGNRWVLLRGEKDIVAKYCRDNNFKVIKQWPYENTYKTSAMCSPEGVDID